MASARSIGSFLETMRPSCEKRAIRAVAARTMRSSRRRVGERSGLRAAGTTIRSEKLGGHPAGAKQPPRLFHSSARDLAIDQAHVGCPRALGRVLVRELYPLAFTEQFEHRATDRGAMEKMLHAAFVANEPEPFVNQQSCNRATGHD